MRRREDELIKKISILEAEKLSMIFDFPKKLNDTIILQLMGEIPIILNEEHNDILRDVQAKIDVLKNELKQCVI